MSTKDYTKILDDLETDINNLTFSGSDKIPVEVDTSTLDDFLDKYITQSSDLVNQITDIDSGDKLHEGIDNFIKEYKEIETTYFKYYANKTSKIGTRGYTIGLLIAKLLIHVYAYRTQLGEIKKEKEKESASPVIKTAAHTTPGAPPSAPIQEKAQIRPSIPEIEETQEELSTNVSYSSNNISDLLHTFQAFFQGSKGIIYNIEDMSISDDDTTLYNYLIYSFYADNKIYISTYNTIIAKLIFLLKIPNAARSNWDGFRLNILGEELHIKKNQFNVCTNSISIMPGRSWKLKNRVKPKDYLDTFQERLNNIFTILAELNKTQIIYTSSGFIENMIINNLDLVSHPIKEIIEKESYLFLEISPHRCMIDAQNRHLYIYRLQIAIFLYDFCSKDDGFTESYKTYDVIIAERKAKAAEAKTKKDKSSESDIGQILDLSFDSINKILPDVEMADEDEEDVDEKGEDSDS